MKSLRKNIVIFGIVAAIFSLSSCINEKFSNDPSHKLTFGRDTLSFDTIFSTIPTYTAELMIYNKNNKALKISSVFLENGANSLFRFNLDGFTPNNANLLKDIEIAAHDSLFLLVEATFNKNDTTLPVYIAENLVFITNGNTQKIVLEAYSQDAVILRNTTLTENTTFTSEKPYLVFGNLIIAEGKTLTLNAGTRIFMHRNANVIANGNIISNGTENERVTICGDRLDAANVITYNIVTKVPFVAHIPYNFLPAQWGAIYLQNEIGENVFKNTTIRSGSDIVLFGNSIINAKLRLENCIIHNMNGFGVFSQFGDLEIINTEISNCGSSCVAVYGGKLKMAQSTIANYFDWATRKDPAVFITNFYVENKIIHQFPIYSAVVENSIIFGKRDKDELVLKDTLYAGEKIMFNVLISNCLIKAKKFERPELENIIWSYSDNQINKTDTVFENTTVDWSNFKEKGYYNFQLAENSRAKDVANPQVAAQYPTDLLGKSRFTDSKPDLGAYERQE